MSSLQKLTGLVVLAVVVIAVYDGRRSEEKERPPRIPLVIYVLFYGLWYVIIWILKHWFGFS